MVELKLIVNDRCFTKPIGEVSDEAFFWAMKKNFKELCRDYLYLKYGDQWLIKERELLNE
jgi:hypothetical protein